MPRPVRGPIFLFFLAFAGSAAAQLPYVPVIDLYGAGMQAEAARPNLPDFRMPRGDLRQAGVPERNGLIAAMPLSDRVTVGVGRFSVLELPRPRTHMEAEPRPTDVRRRDRGIAAVGVSVRF